jgi:hypothetical protein
MAITTLIFTANDTFTVPAGVTSINIEAWGGGGAGYDLSMPGGGGGGAGYFRMDNYSVFENLFITITIGAGGTGAKGDEDGKDTTFLDDYYSSTSYARGGSGTSSPNLGGSYMIDPDHQANCGTYSGANGGNGAQGDTMTGDTGGGGEAAGYDGNSAANGADAEVSVGGSSAYTGGDGGDGTTLSAEGGPGYFPGGGGGYSFDGANGQLIITYGTADVARVVTSGFAIAGNYCF